MAKIQSMSSVAGKETIYVDVDDEITAIIDKIATAKGKVIALVLPKRASVLQSIVNMKLLKRTAGNAQKNLVLITSEAGLLPLAGSVGLYVADTPTSKPSIPTAPASPSDEPEDIDEPLDIVDNSVAAAAEDFDPKAVAATPVGELAGAGASKIAEDDIDESIDMDDEAAPAAAVAATKAVKLKKDKKLKVPNFDSLKKKLLLGGVLLALLITGYIFAFIILPKASITIHTDSSTISTNLNLTLDTTAKALSTSGDVVPATVQTQQKPATQTVPTTGQQNNGQQASGSIKLSQSVCAPNLGQQPADIPTGSSVNSGGNTYITQEPGTYSQGKFSSGSCVQYTTNTIAITALKGGMSYNTSSGADFSGPNKASGTGSASGGTDNITKIVSQTDINTATNQIKAADSSSVKQQLVSSFQAKGLLAVPATFLAGTPQVTTSAKAGDTADNVTVTAVTSYTMLGVKQTDLKNLVDQNVTKQLDASKQVILDDGVANATFSLQNPATATNATVAMAAKSVAGPQLDVAKIKPQLYGKKTGDVQSFLKQTPGVTSVDVKYSPFWVGSVPKKAAKVTVQIDKTGTH